MQTDSDEALIQQAQEGDHEAFDFLIQRHQRRAYNLAYRLLGNDLDAADALQDALMKVYVNLDRFRGQAAFSSWLHRVVVNTCLDELRKHSKQPTLTEIDETRTSADDATQPEEQAQRREMQLALHEAIGRLPERYRTVVLLRDLQGYSYQEIMVTLNITETSLKSRLHRARLALRQIICAMRILSVDETTTRWISHPRGA